MSDPIDVRLVEALHRSFGAAFRYRAPELATRYGVTPPARPGGAGAAAAFVVHHTAGSVRGTYDQIWDLHCRRMGWASPGYGIFVAQSGVVDMGVPPSRLTYGVYGRHAVTYNVALPGNYNEVQPTQAQLDALYRVLCCLDDAYGEEGRIWRTHGEWALKGHGTACPGANLRPHVQMMRSAWYGAARPRPMHYAAGA